MQVGMKAAVLEAFCVTITITIKLTEMTPAATRHTKATHRRRKVAL